MKLAHGIAILAFTLLLTSCGRPPAASDGGFHSPDPAARLYAIQRAGEQSDYSCIPYLIESLESDDPAERMWAIFTLEKMTGDRKGYNPYASLLDRQQPIARWRDALKNGALNLRKQSP